MQEINQLSNRPAEIPGVSATTNEYLAALSRCIQEADAGRKILFRRDKSLERG